MRLDKGTWILVVATIAAALMLGLLAGKVAGVLTAAAGLVPAVLWEATREHRRQVRGRDDLLEDAGRELAPPQQVVDGGVARYLRPEQAVVAFWPRPEFRVLRDWLVSDLPADVRLVVGEGGAGKTRLALRLADEARHEYGWRVYWVTAGGESQAALAACAGQGPVLLVVDYAETRADLGGFLGAVIRGRLVPAVRVLLLARSAGEWWEQLVANCESELSEALAAVPVIGLGPLSAPADQGEVFGQAVQAFAAELGVACPRAVRLPDVGPDAVALVVHAAALLAVLNHGPAGQPGIAPGGAANVIGGLLRHEARYWQQSQAGYGLSLGPALTRRVVAAGTLAGADDEASAVRLLTAVRDLGDGQVRGRVARWLHDLYPAGDPVAGQAEWIGPLRPDLLGEHLVTGALVGQPRLAADLLAELSEVRAGRALTVLARAALADTAAGELIGRLIESDPGGLVIPALAVAVETDPSIGDQVAAALEAGDWPLSLLRQIAAALPEVSVALASTAAITFFKLVELSEGDEERSSSLVNLSNWLSRLGRREEALAAIEEAVTAYRELARARPDAFLPDLAMSLNNQSLRLGDLGRREEALAVIDEAVTIRRELARARPDAFLPDLAMSLNNQSLRLGDLGRPEEALAAIEEAVTIRRELAVKRPAVFAARLRSSLLVLSDRLDAMGRSDDAAIARAEAADLS